MIKSVVRISLKKDAYILTDLQSKTFFFFNFLSSHNMLSHFAVFILS